MIKVSGLIGGASVTVEYHGEDFEYTRLAHNVVIEWRDGRKHIAYFKYTKFAEDGVEVIENHFEVIEYNKYLDEMEARYEEGEGFYEKLIERIKSIAVEGGGVDIITDDFELFERLASLL